MSCIESEIDYTENKPVDLELVEIGSWSISDVETLPNPRYSGFFDDGSLIVTDASLLTINQFNRDGNLISRHGGQGRGPGEFQTMINVHISPDGLIAVADLSSARISLLNLNNDSIVSTDFVSGWNTRVNIVEGGVVIVNHPFSFMREFPGDLQLSFFELESEQTEEFLHLELEQNETPPGQISCTFCDFKFLDDLSFYTSPRDTSYTLYYVDSTGEVISTFTRKNLSPLLYTPEEREELKESRQAALQQVGQSSENYVPPTHKRRVLNWYPDYKNRLWVLVNTADGEPNHIDIFSPSGEYIGSMNLPEDNLRLQHLENDKILFTGFDEDSDLFKAKLYRING